MESDLGKIIKDRRLALGKTLEDVGRDVGVSKSTVQRWESGLIQNMRRNKLAGLARSLSMSPSELISLVPSIDENDTLSNPDMLPIIRHRVPVLGSAACGAPIEKPGDGAEYIDINDDLPCDFALIAQGDSMTVDRIYDGDVVFFRAQDDVDDGQIAAIELDGGMTIKRVKRLRAADGSILFTQLISSNTAYPSIDIGGADETRTARIRGKAVAFKSLLNK